MRPFFRLSSFFFVVLYASASFASGETVKGPKLSGLDLKVRKAAFKKIFKRLRQGERLPRAEVDTAAARLAGMNIESAEFRKEVSVVPMEVRMALFKQLAGGSGGVKTQVRNVRGYMPHLKKTVKSQKELFTFDNESAEIFKRVMGPNVVWFAGRDAVNHLYTWIADQNQDRNEMYSNTYGTDNSYTMEHGNQFHVAFPVLLTDNQMARFVDYLNTGVAHGKRNVYGFYAGPEKTLVGSADVKCTNWVTSAPIGSLRKWIKTVDKEIKRLAGEGRFGSLRPDLEKGLHAALVAVSHAERGLGVEAAVAEAARTEANTKRSAIVNAVLAESSVTGELREGVDKLGRLFEKERRDLFKRSPETVGRESLAETLDLKRSQNPDKFIADLALSKLTPLAAVKNLVEGRPLAEMSFNIRYAGTLGAEGAMIRNEKRHYNGANNSNVEYDEGNQLKPGATGE